VALLIDGAHFAEHVVLAAVGIDSRGEKHPLGLREGATENAAACTALLTDLIERGLNPERAILVVIDGDKALRRAVLDTLGGRALVQRCQAQETQRSRCTTQADACLGPHRDEPGLRQSRSEARPPAARESGA